MLAQSTTCQGSSFQQCAVPSCVLFGALDAGTAAERLSSHCFHRVTAWTPIKFMSSHRSKPSIAC
eukprot:1585102-Karenia_brevis.AAC.1